MYRTYLYQEDPCQLNNDNNNWMLGSGRSDINNRPRTQQKEVHSKYHSPLNLWALQFTMRFVSKQQQCDLGIRDNRAHRTIFFVTRVEKNNFFRARGITTFLLKWHSDTHGRSLTSKVLLVVMVDGGPNIQGFASHYGGRVVPNPTLMPPAAHCQWGILWTVSGCVGSQGRQTIASEAISHQYGTHSYEGFWRFSDAAKSMTRHYRSISSARHT